MQIKQLIAVLEKDMRCQAYPPDGMPALFKGLELPEDLVAFYGESGGLKLFPEEPFGFRIVGPKEFVPANPMLLGQFYVENKG